MTNRHLHTLLAVMVILLGGCSYQPETWSGMDNTHAVCKYTGHDSFRCISDGKLYTCLHDWSTNHYECAAEHAALRIKLERP